MENILIPKEYGDFQKGSCQNHIISREKLGVEDFDTIGENCTYIKKSWRWAQC